MLDTNNSILFIIDIQEKLTKAGFKGKDAAHNMAKVVKAAQILNIPTIVTEQYPKGLGTTDEEIKNNLPQHAVTVEKAAFSAMTESGVKKFFEDKKQKQIVLGGIETHICVLQTAMDLIQQGYKVCILEDCSSSRHEYEHNTGIELLKQAGAKIVCTEIVLFEWLRTSKHPRFKEVQALIK